MLLECHFRHFYICEIERALKALRCQNKHGIINFCWLFHTHKVKHELSHGCFVTPDWKADTFLITNCIKYPHNGFEEKFMNHLNQSVFLKMQNPHAFKGFFSDVQANSDSLMGPPH